MESELAYYEALDDLRALGSDDHAIVHTVPAALERVRMAKARHQERLTAYVAYREHAVR
jgi:hypothetical protein